MTTEFITTQTQGKVATITLNRPKQLNALNDQADERAGRSPQGI